MAMGGDYQQRSGITHSYYDYVPPGHPPPSSHPHGPHKEGTWLACRNMVDI